MFGRILLGFTVAAFVLPSTASAATPNSCFQNSAPQIFQTHGFYRATAISDQLKPRRGDRVRVLMQLQKLRAHRAVSYTPRNSTFTPPRRVQFGRRAWTLEVHNPVWDDIGLASQYQLRLEYSGVCRGRAFRQVFVRSMMPLLIRDTSSKLSRPATSPLPIHPSRLARRGVS